MRRILAICTALLFVAGAAVGAEVKITPPTVDFGSNSSYDLIDAYVNGVLKALAQQAESQLNEEIGAFEQPSFVEGMANAGIFASHVGVMRSRFEYGFLQVGAGIAIGFQSPTANPFDVEGIGQAMAEGGDVFAGVGVQAGGQVGLNASFLKEGLFLGLRFGRMDLTSLAESMGDALPEGLSGSLSVVGVLASYQLVKPVDLMLIRWRGVNIGSGLVYQGLEVRYKADVDPVSYEQEINKDIDNGGYLETGTVTLTAVPTVEVGVQTGTVAIPLEVSTGMRVLILNVSGGLGADLAFGSSKLLFDADARIEASGSITHGETGTKLYINNGTITPGSAVLDAGTEGGPTFLNPKVFASVGLLLGPISLEIPFTYYINEGSGFNAGITLGLTF
ncbi:Lsa36 family surface (lipo)protein [Spirochaeta thermophila]|uniref:Uncharacterized protein n=1 Tax=Winmispira thermophila (strain ATCC 49972 / DSM 6192 / RI 19.B1) TaxID=665571 RepID=E0RQ66_WINT6|nr:hypothetical protein [Spirochaeta thermophila]ADN01450.1 hypothetical protein STHERM_c04790 [Spirochaeta thermophila DSM 6192]